MKKLTIVLMLFLAFVSCKNDKKQSTQQDEVKQKELVITKLNIPDIKNWKKAGIDIKETTLNYKQNKVYSLERSATSKSSFVFLKKQLIEPNNSYRVGVIVKKGEKTNLFELRMAGIYPNRMDAVFDLEKGKVVGTKKTNDFKNGKAMIESLGEGWYKCTIESTITLDNIKILFGPSIGNSFSGWKDKINPKSSVLIVPNSLSIEKITFE